MVTSLTPGGLPKIAPHATRKQLPFSSAATTQRSPLSSNMMTQGNIGSGASLAKNMAMSAPLSSAQVSSPFSTSPLGSLQELPAATFQLSQNKMAKTGTERTLEQLETRYKTMMDGIQLKYFNPDKIENYIRMAEKRMGMELTEKERARLIQISKSTDPRILKLLALELRIGIPKRLEQAALAALGELMLHRDDVSALESYLEDPTKDDNLKAYVRTALMMHRVEKVMAKVDTVKNALQGWFGGSGNGGGQQQKKKQKQNQPQR